MSKQWLSELIEQPYEWCIETVTKEPELLKNIKVQTQELCEIAFYEDYKTAKYIHQEFRFNERILAIARQHSLLNKSIPQDMLEKINEYPYNYFEKKYPEIFF